MKNLLYKIKNSFVSAWQWLTRSVATYGPRVKPYGNLLFGFLIAAVLILSGVYYIADRDRDKTNNAEIAQVLDPSIGTALAPDTPGDVGGATTNNPPAVAPTSGVNLNAGFVSPKAGVNDTDPVKYKNDQLKFSAILPAGTQVSETENSIVFTSKNGQLYYSVNTAPAQTETLESIKSQLQNSSSVSTITTSKVGATPAVTFTNRSNFGAALIHNNHIYYLVGQKQYVHTFQTL